MDDANNGKSRLDRLEEFMADMIEHHEREFKSLLTWQVLMQDKMDKFHAYQQAEAAMRKHADDALDKRVSDLVGAIRDLVDRIPPENLKHQP